jgi:hypothetical protein
MLQTLVSDGDSEERLPNAHLPVSKPETTLVGTAAQIDDQGQNQESHNGDDLDTGKDEFGLTINADGKDVQRDDDDQDDADPHGLIDGIVPETNDDGGGRDLGTQRQRVRIPIVPTDGEPHRRVDVTSTVLGDGTGEREPGRHLPQTLHHGVDGDTGHGVTE